MLVVYCVFSVVWLGVSWVSGSLQIVVLRGLGVVFGGILATFAYQIFAFFIFVRVCDTKLLST